MLRLELGSIAALSCCVVMACGGDTSGDGGGSCATRACGGNVVGTWAVQNTCLDGVGMAATMSLDAPECEGSLRDVQARSTGTWTFSATGTVTQNVSLVIDMELAITSACVGALTDGSGSDPALICRPLEQEFSRMPEYAAVACGVQGNACVCMLSTAEQRIDASGSYRVEGSQLVSPSGRHPFCVEGDQLQVENTVNGVTGGFTLMRVP